MPFSGELAQLISMVDKSMMSYSTFEGARIQPIEKEEMQLNVDSINGFKISSPGHWPTLNGPSKIWNAHGI